MNARPIRTALLLAWMAAGAIAAADEKAESNPQDHWAFRPCLRPPVPAVANTAWVQNPIDAFVAQQQARYGLTPQVAAPRELQLRRLFLDLIGVPPTPAEIETALQDPSERWDEKIVDRLLADPRHGERWARHWMDIWRYSDWWGLGEQLRNSQKHIWHWRDWIIESLNADTPYDEMLRLMLAADELYPNDLEKLRATGFLARNWFLFNRHQWLEETVEHVSKGFLGLTINCAKCHDHKYDPIAQVDFYRLRAVFEPYQVRLDVRPGEPDLERDGIACAFEGALDTPTYRFVRGQENQPDKSVAIAPGIPALLNLGQLAVQPVPLPLEAWQPERRAWVLPAYLSAARKKWEAAEAIIPQRKQELASALRSEANLLTGADSSKPLPAPQTPAPDPTSGEKARDAVEEARKALNVAEEASALAHAELVAVQRRIDATKASWDRLDGRRDDPNLARAEGEKIPAAVKAERDALVAKARYALAEARQRAPKERDSAKPAKEIEMARAALDKAIKAADSPLQTNESYTPFVGAKWTPTRFLSSGTDDPIVKFAPQSSGRRKALAEWITDRRNPLAARVAVNHIWMRHMGTPLVGTVFDFGRKGAPPSHPELLDWLAVELMESGWSMKHLHKLIVSSSAYRMSSSLGGGEANAARDPDNIHLWRRGPIRLEAEVVRDSVLSLAGTLDPTLGGPPVPPAAQEDSKRRSLYFFHSNNERNLFLTTFDEAAVEECYRRDQSIVPQQALALINSRLSHDAASRIATQLSDSAGSGSGPEVSFIRRSFETVLGIQAGDAEMAASRKALAAWRKEGLPLPTDAEGARANFIWALLNHNDFVTLR